MNNDKLNEILAINETIIERLTDDNAETDSNGNNKYASEAATKMIRREIKENGFARSIIPEQTVTEADIQQQLDTDEPVIYGEVEPKGPGATVVPFDASIDTHIFTGRKFPVHFNQMVTPEITKNVLQLYGYKNDIRKLITEATLNNVETKEDAMFMSHINTIVGPTSGVGLSGRKSNFEINAKPTRETYPFIKKFMHDRKLTVGTVLMNNNTALEFEAWDALDLGDEVRTKIMQGGLGAGLTEARIAGVKHLFTTKRDIIADGEVYLFAPPEYFGVWYKLKDLTMYVKRDRDHIKMSASQVFGQAIVNLAGVVKVKFNTTDITNIT